MVEDIGKIISNGFETYTRNFNLCIPFVINVFITGILAIIIFGFGFLYLFGSSLSSFKDIATPQAFMQIILPIIKRHIFEIILLVLIYFLITLFLQSFFMAGGIGMAQMATETGKSELSTMMDSGKKNVMNLYLAEVLVGLLSLAGIILMVPGALKADFGNLSFEKNAGAIILLVVGLLLWFLYMIILNLVLSVYRYALVIENLGPVEGITAGFGFFKQHKFDVFILWLVIVVIIVVVTIVGQIMGLIPIINMIWPLINVLISILVIAPLTVIWWVRLYMTRTDKKIYFNDLLTHPNDLGKS